MKANPRILRLREQPFISASKKRLRDGRWEINFDYYDQWGYYQAAKSGRRQFTNEDEAERFLERLQPQRRNPTPDEWDDIVDEGARLGSIQARALGRSEREHRARARYFNVTWYSKRKGGRVGFIRPIEATSAADAKQQAKVMVTNEKPVNIVAKEVTSNPANERLMACSVAQLQRELKYHNAKSPAAVAIRNMLREKKKQQKNPGLIAFAEGVQAADYLGKKFKIRNPCALSEIQRQALALMKARNAGAVFVAGNWNRWIFPEDIRTSPVGNDIAHAVIRELSKRVNLTARPGDAEAWRRNPGFFTTTRQRKAKAQTEDYLGRTANPTPDSWIVVYKDERGNWHELSHKFKALPSAMRAVKSIEKKHPNWIVGAQPFYKPYEPERTANPKNKANDDWWIARVREVFPAVVDEMPSKRFAESYSYLLERMETPQAKRIMRKMYGVKYANLQFRTSFNPNDSSVRSPTRTSTEVKSPTKTSTSTWAKTTGNITVTGGAGAGATTRVTVRRNPGEYEQSVKIIESAIRKAVARAKRQGTIGMSAANLKQLLSTIDLRGVNLAGPGVFNRAFDEALARFQRTAKFRIINPSVIALAETFQGRASGAVKEFKAAGSAPSDLARIGKLVFLKLADSRRQIAAPGAMVAVDTKGKLWIVSQRAPMFTQKAAPGEALDFGEIERICYLTAKQHIESGKLTEYVHTFGEDSGKRPHLLVDHEGMPILRGGEYQIRAEGIVN